MEKLVKVKMLKSAGTYVQGQEIEVSESQAKALCEPRRKNNGTQVVEFRLAMLLHEYQEKISQPIDIGGLTLAESKELGIKNVVEIPKADLNRPFAPGFAEVKDPMEGSSAKMAEQLNQNHASKRKVAS